MKEWIDFWTTVHKNPLTPFALCFSASMFWLGVFSGMSAKNKKSWEELYNLESE